MPESPASDASDSLSVTVEQPLRAGRARIWRACTDPRELSRWQADRAERGADPERRLVLGWPKLGLSAEVEIVDSVKERRLALRHGTTDVVFTIADRLVSVTHAGLPDGETADGVRSSWGVSLAVLAHYLEHHDGSDRHVSWHVARVTTSPAAAHVYFTDARALAAWLTASGEIGAAGAPVQLDLSWSEPLTGRVLANTPGRDVAFSWNEHDDSVIALRTLPSPAAPSDRVLVLSWSNWHGAADHRTDAELGAALVRLQRVLGGGGSA